MGVTQSTEGLFIAPAHLITAGGAKLRRRRPRPVSQLRARRKRYICDGIKADMMSNCDFVLFTRFGNFR